MAFFNQPGGSRYPSGSPTRSGGATAAYSPYAAYATPATTYGGSTAYYARPAAAAAAPVYAAPTAAPATHVLHYAAAPGGAVTYASSSSAAAPAGWSAPKRVSAAVSAGASIVARPSPASVEVKAAPARCSVSRAVLVGTNYTGQKGLELKGCINDVSNTLNVLRDLGFDGKEEVNLRVLTDVSRRKPVKQEMLEAMKWLLQGAKAGDVLWWHYSGHGTREPEAGTKDDSGEGESIVPFDYTKNGSIVDEQMYLLMVQPIPKDVMLYAVFDCCHSGRVLNLRNVYDEYHNKLWADPQYRERKAEEGNVIMLSGCMTTQTSADLPPEAQQAARAKSVGALTSAFLPLLKKGYCWSELIKELRGGLKASHLTQVPQLESATDFDLSAVAYSAAFPPLAVSGVGAAGDYVHTTDHLDGVHDVNHRIKHVRTKLTGSASGVGSATAAPGGDRGIPAVAASAAFRAAPASRPAAYGGGARAGAAPAAAPSYPYGRPAPVGYRYGGAGAAHKPAPTTTAAAPGTRAVSMPGAAVGSGHAGHAYVGRPAAGVAVAGRR